MLRTLACALLAALLWPSAGAGAQAPVALEKVYACTTLADAGARLACFDEAVAAARSAQDRGEFAAVDAARVREIERESFGFSIPSLPRLVIPAGEGPTPEIESRIVRVGRSEGRPALTLENGQTWVITDSGANRLARAGSPVRIRRASLGSYLMIPEAGAGLRVRRLQ